MFFMRAISGRKVPITSPVVNIFYLEHMHERKYKLIMQIIMYTKGHVRTRGTLFLIDRGSCRSNYSWLQNLKYVAFILNKRRKLWHQLRLGVFTLLFVLSGMQFMFSGLVIELSLFKSWLWRKTFLKLFILYFTVNISVIAPIDTLFLKSLKNILNLRRDELRVFLK